MNQICSFGVALVSVVQSADPRIVTWHALQSGDAAIVRQGRTGYILELEDWEFKE